MNPVILDPAKHESLEAGVDARLDEWLDAEWPPHGGLGIDVATPDAAQRLVSVAKATLRKASALALQRFVEPGAADGDDSGASPFESGTPHQLS